MWRFIKGVDNPAKRKTNVSEQQEEKKRNYEKTKRTRCYQKSWEGEYTWISYDSESQKMFCKLCRKFDIQSQKGGNKNVFKEGTDNFRLDTVRFHAASEAHVKAEGMEAAEALPVGTSNAEIILHKLNKKEFDRLEKLFRYVKFLTKYVIHTY